MAMESTWLEAAGLGRTAELPVSWPLWPVAHSILAWSPDQHELQRFDDGGWAIEGLCSYPTIDALLSACSCAAWSEVSRGERDWASGVFACVEQRALLEWANHPQCELFARLRVYGTQAAYELAVAEASNRARALEVL